MDPNFQYHHLFSAGSELAIDAVLPRGKTDTDFYSATLIPSDYTMMWNFVLPPKHNFTVHFLNYTEPKCQSKTAEVSYKLADMPSVTNTLADQQPENYKGSFSLSLTNCDLESGGGPRVPGLFLNFRVSVFRSGVPGRKILSCVNAKRLVEMGLISQNQYLSLWYIIYLAGYLVKMCCLWNYQATRRLNAVLLAEHGACDCCSLLSFCPVQICARWILRKG